MYCSIQEAWGNDFGSMSNNSKLVNEGFEDFKQKKKNRKRRDQHKNNYIENRGNSQEYIRGDTKSRELPFVVEEDTEYQRGTNYIEGDNQKKYSFTRGLARLPDHNGPEVRDIQQDNMQNIYQEEETNNYQEEETNNYQEDNYEEEEIMDQGKSQRSPQQVEETTNLYKSDHNLSFLLDKINILIDKFDNRGENNNTNVVLFVLTGIFIIFVLDSVFKFGKYLRE
jgi:hypothetical protein